MLYVKIDSANLLYELMLEADRPFSYEACEALINFYDGFDDVEFDAIAIACDWNEVKKTEVEDFHLDQLEGRNINGLTFYLKNGNILFSSY